MTMTLALGVKMTMTMTATGSCARLGDVRPVAQSGPRRRTGPCLGAALCRLRPVARPSDSRGGVRRLLASHREADAATVSTLWRTAGRRVAGGDELRELSP